MFRQTRDVRSLVGLFMQAPTSDGAGENYAGQYEQEQHGDNEPGKRVVKPLLPETQSHHGDGQRSSCTNTYVLGLGDGQCRRCSWTENNISLSNEKKPVIWRFIDDPHGSPGFDRDGTRIEHSPAKLIIFDTDDGRGDSAPYLGLADSVS